MVKCRETLRLRAMGVSRQNTARSCGCAQSTVQEVEKRARAIGLVWPLPEEMDDAAIRARLYQRAFTMYVGCKCGGNIEVDWAGDRMERCDPDTGLARRRGSSSHACRGRSARSPRPSPTWERSRG